MMEMVLNDAIAELKALPKEVSQMDFAAVLKAVELVSINAHLRRLFLTICKGNECSRAEMGIQLCTFQGEERPSSCSVRSPGSH